MMNAEDWINACQFAVAIRDLTPRGDGRGWAAEACEIIEDFKRARDCENAVSAMIASYRAHMALRHVMIDHDAEYCEIVELEEVIFSAGMPASVATDCAWERAVSLARARAEEARARAEEVRARATITGLDADASASEAAFEAWQDACYDARYIESCAGGFPDSTLIAGMRGWGCRYERCHLLGCRCESDGDRYAL